MKYDPTTKVLAFESDDDMSRFHDQLTGIMRDAMTQVGNEETGDEEASRLTMDFFQRYSALTDALICLREHLPRGDA